MAMTSKQGLDYFSHDVDMSQDDKIQLVEAEFGLIGYAIINKLLEKIYRNGYYLEINEKVIKLFARKNNIEIDVCIKVINACINENLFNQDLYKSYEILTSTGIQKRYLEAVKRRKEVYLYREFLLINLENGVNANINIINVNINPINDNIKKQSKVKESKVKIYSCPFFIEFWNLYPKKEGKGEAWKAWLKVDPKPNNEMIKIMENTIIKYKKTDQWKKDNGQFIPLPSTWLNQRRWEDEPGMQDKSKIFCPKCGLKEIQHSGLCLDCYNKL